MSGPPARSASPSVPIGRATLIGLLYAALAFALLVPFSLHMASRAMSPGSDENFTLWVFAWDVHAFLHQPLHIFDANIMAPLPNTLGYEENGIGSALMAAPILWATGNVLLAVNVVGFLTIPLSGLGVYVLARKLRIGEAGAILAGLFFALDPPRFFRLEQFHITAIQWIPFCLAFLHAYLDGARRRDLWIALGFFSAQALTGGHGTAFLMIAIALLLLFRLVMGEPIALMTRIRDLGSGVLLLIPAVLIYLPYHRARAEAGLERTLEGWYTPPASFLATPSRIDSAIAAHFPPWLLDSPRAYLFPGYVILVFLAAAPWFLPKVKAISPAAAGVRWLGRLATLLEVIATVYVVAGGVFAWFGVSRIKVDDSVLVSVRHPARLWIVAGLAITLRWLLSGRVPFALGNRVRSIPRALGAWRERARTSPAVFYSLLAIFTATLLLGPPFGLWQFVYWIPPLSFIRAPLRFSLLVVLGLAIVLGAIFDRLSSRWTSRVRVGAAWLLGALLVVEFSAIPLEGGAVSIDLPSIDRWLNTQPKPFTIAEVPLASPSDVGRFNSESATYMLHSTAHFQKTVMGFSGVLPPDHGLLYEQLSQFPDEDGLEHLLAFHVTYVVVHGDDYSPEAFAALEERLLEFRDWLTLVHAEGRERVYAIHAPGGR